MHYIASRKTFLFELVSNQNMESYEGKICETLIFDKKCPRYIVYVHGKQMSKIFLKLFCTKNLNLVNLSYILGFVSSLSRYSTDRVHFDRVHFVCDTGQPIFKNVVIKYYLSVFLELAQIFMPLFPRQYLCMHFSLIKRHCWIISGKY